MRLGIDFGTTRTVVSAAADGRYPVATFELEGEVRDHLSGAVAAGPGASDPLVFGPLAARVASEGGWGLSSIKRVLPGASPDSPVPGRPQLTVLELVTQYLRWVRRTLLERSNFGRLLEGSGPLEAMVAVPAQSDSRQRYVTLEAFARAGFEVLGLVGEPTAAAIEYGLRNVTALSPRSPKQFVVVYDLGGGTFDTAAVSLLGRRFELLASEGISRLGGEDFDALIARQALGRVAGAPTFEALDPGRRVALLERVRAAKEGLSTKNRKMLVEVPGAGDAVEPVVLDTASVYAACMPLIERTTEQVDRLLARLAQRGLDIEDPRKLGALYLVGGSAAFVPVARALRARYGRKILLAAVPHAATAVGLAVAADPDAELLTREAVTRFFGVWREAEGGKEKVFDAILSKDTVPPEEGAPLVVQRCYRPAHAIGHLRFLECTALTDDGQPAGDLTPWDEVRFPYDPGLADRPELSSVPVERRSGELEEEIVETYTHAPDGTIAVAIENRTRGYRREYSLGALR